MCEKVKLLIHLKLAPLLEIFPVCPEAKVEQEQPPVKLNFEYSIRLSGFHLLILEPVINSINYKIGSGSSNQIKLDGALNGLNLSVTRTLNNEKSEKNAAKILEEAFFRSHPRSLQRTVEFVIDRIVSNSVKELRTGFLPDQLRSINRDLKEFFAEKVEILSTQYITDYIDETVEKTKVDCVAACIEKSRNLIDATVDENLKFLFAKDLNEKVIETAAKIIKRDAKDKTEKWFKEHVPMIVLRDGKPAFERSRKRAASNQNQNTKPPVQYIPHLTYTNLDIIKGN